MTASAPHRTVLDVRLPYPPTANNAYRVAGRSLVKTDEAKSYATSVQEVLMVLSAAKVFRRAVEKGNRFAVSIWVHPPDRRKRDLANTEKLAIDAVFRWLGIDDSSIDHLQLTRADRVDGGELNMTITVLEERYGIRT